MKEKVRWGILGLGSIAKQFARGLVATKDAELVAVGSRSKEKAEAFGAEFNAPHRHASYEALVADPEVDAIYVSTPHPYHAENSLLCLRAGKEVLCEKPFALNARQAREVIDCARRRRLFLMEAMWTRFLPAICQVRQWLASGAIGEVRMLTADFGFRAGWNPESRLLNPHLGGGALLDVGVYTVAFAYMVMGGAPKRIESMADIGKTGVDEQSAILLGFEGGRLALLSCAVRTGTPHSARIDGTDGRIEVPRFWHTTEATLTAGERTEHFEQPHEGNGYNYEAAEVGRCLRAGKLESDIMPLDETLSIMQTLDTIRGQWGMRYPQE